jgi:hypothetical protein
MLPTRADMIAVVAVGGRPFICSAFSFGDALFRGKNGEKCFIINMGPSVLVRNVNSASSALICDGDFSGKRRPGTMKASWSWWDPGLKCFLHSAAASAIVVSSV